MNIIRCSGGHFYDTDKNSSCPYCGAIPAPVVPSPTPQSYWDGLSNEMLSGDTIDPFPFYDNDEMESLRISDDIPVQTVNYKEICETEKIFKLNIKDIIIYKSCSKVISSFELTNSENELDIYIIGMPMSFDVDSVSIKGKGISFDSITPIKYEVDNLGDEGQGKELLNKLSDLKNERDYTSLELDNLKGYLKSTTQKSDDIMTFSNKYSDAKELYSKLSRELSNLNKEIDELSDTCNKKGLMNNSYRFGVKAHIYLDSLEQRTVVVEYVDTSITWKSSYSVFATQDSDEIRVDFVGEINSYSQIKYENVNVTVSTGLNKSLVIPRIGKFVLSRRNVTSTDSFSVSAGPKTDILCSPLMPNSAPTSSDSYGASVNGNINGAMDSKANAVSATSNIETDAFAKSIEYKIKNPITIESGLAHSVVLKSDKITVEKRYFAIPSYSKNAYTRLVTSQLSDLFEADTNEPRIKVFYDGEFIRTPRVEKIRNDNGISLSLIDGITTTKTIVESKKSKNILKSANNLYTKYLITIENNLSYEVTLDVFDNIPVSDDSDINVKVMNDSGAELDAKTGIAKWIVNIQPQTKNVIEVEYTITYPDKLDIVRKK